MNNELLSGYVSDITAELIKTDTDMTLKLARALIRAVEARAAQMSVNAVVAVSNSGANTVAAECMDGAYIASYDIAVNKAFTAVALKMTTEKLKGLSQPQQPLYGIQFSNGGRIVIFGGGAPLTHHGRVIGGLGVSGGTEEQDTALCAYGAELFRQISSNID